MSSEPRSTPRSPADDPDRLGGAWWIDKGVRGLIFIGGISAIIFVAGIFIFITKEGLGFILGRFDWEAWFGKKRVVLRLNQKARDPDPGQQGLA